MFDTTAGSDHVQGKTSANKSHNRRKNGCAYHRQLLLNFRLLEIQVNRLAVCALNSPATILSYKTLSLLQYDTFHFHLSDLIL